MAFIDVFNGDADGLCALLQLRLATPVNSTLVTGVKRNISLLQRVHAGTGDQVTVLDISLDKNRPDLQRLLEHGAHIRYFDHHYAGEIPSHPHLQTHIDPAPDRGTSLLVDTWLQGRYRAWAVVGTFGDHFDQAARQAASTLKLDQTVVSKLRDLGLYLNYNAYGATVDDLLIPPAGLFQTLLAYPDPVDFIDRDPAYKGLQEGYQQDMHRAGNLQPEMADAHRAVYILPDERWARRISGVLANQLAREAPERAHALLTRLPDDGFLVSVRAPLIYPDGADTLCRQFATGGGRKAAAGINHLPGEQLDAFVAAFFAAYDRTWTA